MNQFKKYKLVLKKFEPELNLNHNIYTLQCNIFECCCQYTFLHIS